MKKKLLIMVMFVCVLGLVAQAETVVTTADGVGADTFLGNDSNKDPDDNFGDWDDMDVRDYVDPGGAPTRAHIGYFRWDITDIGGMDPTGAQLRLWLTYAQNTRDIAVYALNDNILDDNWDESTITYNNAPGFLPTDPEGNGDYIIDDNMTYLGYFSVPGDPDQALIEAVIVPEDPNGANPLEAVIKADTNNKITLALIGPTDRSGRQFFFRTKEGVAAETDPNLIDLVIPPTLVLPADVNPFWATNPSPAMNEVVTSSLSELSWTNPEPNEIGGTITCDVYYGTTEPNAALADYGLTTLVTGTDSNSVSLPVAPDPLTRYYWVVDVHDSTQSGTIRGRAWSYNTLNNPPIVDAGADQYVWVDKELVTPDADTWVRDGSTDNYGDDGEMYLYGGAGRVGYIRFDLSAYNAADIVDATLTLTKVPAPWGRSDTMVTGRVGVVGLDNVAGNTAQDWGELVLASDNVGDEFLGGAGGNYPIDATKSTNLDAENGASVTENVEDGVTFTLTGPDLLTFLQNRINDNGLVTLIATLPDNDKGFWLGAKENADPTAAPVLNLVTVTNPGTVDVTLDGTVTDDGQPYGTLAYLWEQLSGPDTVTISPDNTEDVTVTIGTAGLYEFQLTGDDGQEAVADTVQVYVGTDACDAAQNVPGYVANIADLNADCFVDLVDQAILAAEWLNCDSLDCP